MKLIITMLASCLLLSIYAMAQPHGKGIGFGPNNNPARVTPKPTPPDTITVGKKENRTRIGCSASYIPWFV
ncbi:MAG: hypothetical protein DMF29_05835 [Verrucomicrobia bacterium]|nr:MAG: hypothetical protein DMF29_05835 [Verrucomicrobiota bacterium]